MLTDWLMVIITFVYVVATIFICRANMQSAKASKKQLDEMQRQFAEQNRPNIEVEYVYLRNSVHALRFINHGNCLANHVKIDLNSDLIDKLQEELFANYLCKQLEKECIIGVDQHIDLLLGQNIPNNIHSGVFAIGRVCYEGNGQQYETDFNVDIEQYRNLLTVGSETGDIIKQLKEINATLKKIDNSIRVSASVSHKEEPHV